MAKIEIIGCMDELDRTLDLLQRIGTVHIDEIPTIEDARHVHIHRIHLDETKERLLERYEELTETVREILSTMSSDTIGEVALDDEIREELQQFGPDELLKRISKISRNVRRLVRQRKNLVQDMESTRQYESLIQSFLPLLEQSGAIGKLEQIGIILNRGESSVIHVLENRIKEMTGFKSLFLHQRMNDGRTGVFIAVEPDDLPAVRKLLGNEGVSEYHIPREFRKTSFSDSLETIRNRIETIPREIEEIDRQLLEEKRENAALLRYILALGMNRLNRLRILSRLVRTQYNFVISGWTPVALLSSLKESISEQLKDRVYVGQVIMNDLDFMHIPTMISNRGLFRASEVLMKLLPPPGYRNLDATPFIALFFPLFFGIILGDMAYGLTLLVISGLIKWRAKRRSILADAGTVGLAAGVSTMLFGLLFGEFLGDFGGRFGLRPAMPWLHRAEAIEMLLILALGIGVIHIILGFVLKGYVSFIMKHRRGVIESLAKVTFILGMVGFFSQLFLGFPIVVRHVAYILLGTGFLVVLATEGFIGILELFSIFGNILSYSRIMAIGLASVILAVVANRLAKESPHIIAGVLLAFCIHLVNFIMGIFSPTIHSLRLHYVEFFSKFFVASGRPFQPFQQTGEDLT